MNDALAQLASLNESLNADGYELRVETAAGGHLGLAVVALEGACKECLVPKEVMVEIIRSVLTKAAGPITIDLRYPDEV